MSFAHQTAAERPAPCLLDLLLRLLAELRRLWGEHTKRGILNLEMCYHGSFYWRFDKEYVLLDGLLTKI